MPRPSAEPARTPRWPAVVFVVGVVVAIVGLVIVSIELTMAGLVVLAVGGYAWRYTARRARFLADRGGSTEG